MYSEWGAVRAGEEVEEVGLVIAVTAGNYFGLVRID